MIESVRKEENVPFIFDKFIYVSEKEATEPLPFLNSPKEKCICKLWSY